MDIHFGLIRDKQGIYAILQDSRSRQRQLAVCYNSDGKLLVKIAVVKDISGGKDGKWVTVFSPDDDKSELTIPIDHIQSIYPIRDFA